MELTTFDVGSWRTAPKPLRPVRKAITTGEFDDAIETAKANTVRRVA